MCKVDNCENLVFAKGFCRKHYLRDYRYGDVNAVKERKDYIKKGKESPNYKHGKWDHYLYKTWKNMMSRCYSESDHAYKNYGARGIKVCDRWHDINNFILDMHPKPEGKSLDRIDNQKGYCPENCRWASDTTQSRNRRYAKLDIEKANKIRNLKSEGVKRAEIANMFGVSISLVKKVISGEYWKN